MLQLVVNPYLLSISISVPTRRVGVSTVVATHFTTLQFYRKGEDGCVDISFYDWHYLGEYFPTPIISASIHSRAIDIIIPQSTYKVAINIALCSGTLYGSRTRISSVKGTRPNH